LLYPELCRMLNFCVLYGKIADCAPKLKGILLPSA
jgi:hypothetical protein